MKTTLLILAAFLVVGGLIRAEDTKIDFERAKQLFEKQRDGGTLTSEERLYMEEAKRQHEAMQKPSGNAPAPANDGFDWERAKQLHQRVQNGETLSAEDQKFYDEAKRRFESGRGPNANSGGQPPANDGFDWRRAREIYEKKQGGGSLTPEEQKILDEAMKRRGQGGGNNGGGSRPQSLSKDTPPAEAAKGLVPLTELTGDYHGRDGGLYGGGKNDPPSAQQALATKAIEALKPLDADGKPSAGGKIVLMSLGMSNTTMEFSAFVQLANADSRKADNVVIVDAAQGGKAAAQWASADAPSWSVAEERLKAAGVTPKQVQILFVKQANIQPHEGTDAEIKRLQDDIESDVTIAKQKYPNLRIAFLSSRIYAGYAQSRLNPEPYAYEGAFAVRGLIAKQIAGDSALAAGKAPVLLWGPYLWATGSTPRKSDGLTWLPEDFAGDGTHPGASGRDKVAKQLLEFFTTNANAKPWFVKKS